MKGVIRIEQTLPEEGKDIVADTRIEGVFEVVWRACWGERRRQPQFCGRTLPSCYGVDLRARQDHRRQRLPKTHDSNLEFIQFIGSDERENACGSGNHFRIAPVAIVFDGNTYSSTINDM